MDKKNSARMTDKKTENGNKLVIFRGCEVNPNGSFKEYGYYGIFFDESKNYYYVVYPQTATFPNGKQIDVKNKYQQQVCKDMVTADYENGTHCSSCVVIPCTFQYKLERILYFWGYFCTFRLMDMD